jgi:hypothetical protein
VLGGGCEGTELACSEGVGASQFGRAVAKVEQGESYLVVLSGNSGDSGNVELAVSNVTCPDTDLTDQPLPAGFTTVSGPDDHTPACDNQGLTPQPEKTFRFTADESALYRFSASSEDFRPVITVYEGVICGGDYLACNAGQVGATAYPAEVGRFLQAGESVTLVVEGEDGEGQFDFNIEQLPNPGSGGCYDVPDLGSSVSGTVNVDGLHEISTSCGWAGNGLGYYGEHVFKLTVNLPNAVSFCSVDVNFVQMGGVYLLEGGDCSGAELECYDASHQFDFAFGDNGEYLLVVESQDRFGGILDYDIENFCN